MKITYIIICLLSVVILPVKAQLQQNFNILNMGDGLSDNTITSIIKDSEGFMWFGSSNGLNQYDGKNIRIFKLTNSSNKNINKIISIDKENLLIRSDKKLYVFSKRYERFILLTFPQHENTFIKDFAIDRQKRCWIIHNNGLSVINLDNIDFYSHSDSLNITDRENVSINNSKLDVIYCDTKSDSLFLATNKGEIISINTSNKKYDTICNIPIKMEYSINSIYYNEKQIWIATIDDGIYNYNIENRDIMHWISNNTGHDKLLSHNDVYQILQLNTNQLLALTWNGCTLINNRGNKQFNLQPLNLSNSQYQYGETRMISGYADPDGIIWIGTEGGGILYYDSRDYFYKKYIQGYANEICGIQTDDKDHLWIATFHKGILRSKKPINYDIPLEFEEIQTPMINDKTVLCSTMDQKENLWFGLSSGVVLRLNSKQKWEIIKLKHPNNISTTVWSLIACSENEGWAGTSNGLFHIDWIKKEANFIAWNNDIASSCLYIRSITKSNNGLLWLGSEKGLIRLDISKGWEKHNISFNYGYEDKFTPQIILKEVRTLYNSNNNFIWIGYAGNGLAQFSISENKIINNYTTEQGLCSNFISAITEDENQSLWIGSNSGISRLSKHLQSFYNYYISGSNKSVLYVNNLLFWGNNNTLTYFYPQKLNKDNTAQQGKILFTNLEVNHIPVNINDTIGGQVILKQSLNYNKSIILDHQNNSFSITFTNLSYSNKQQKYLYRLYPYQNNWILTNEANKISYDKVPTGEYTFQVKTIFQNQDEGDVCSLDISITPHWSETNIFYLITILIIIIILILISRYIYLKEKRKQYELRLEHELYIANVERNKEIELRKEREQLFTIAAHEIRTPLTLIIAPLQEILGHINPSHTFYKKLSIILKYATGLQKQTDQLLYMQKIEAGMVKLKITEIKLTPFLDEITSYFKPIAEKQHITLSFNYKSNISIWGDSEKIYSVIQNLLTNAFKYTPENGYVKIYLDNKIIDDQQFAIIEVSDSGCGIDNKFKDSIFEPYFTGNNKPNFTTSIGLGLRIVRSIVELHHGYIKLQSEKGMGTTFSIYIPINKNNFSKEEINETEEINDNNTNEYENISIKENTVIEINNDNINYNDKKNKPSILIIEDNKDVRLYICSLFYKQYNVILAENGKQGLEQAIKNVPDIIISDIMMPIMDGITCCSEIRKHKETSHIPIILLTAKTDDEDYIHSTQVGADEYIRKPFNPEVLITKTKHMIEMRKQLKKIYTKALLSPKVFDIKENEEHKEITDEFIQEVMNCIQANISNSEFNVKELASALNMSKATLYRKLKQHTDLSAIELIRNMRMTQAALLLSEKKFSIIEVAEQVGFNDLPTFRKHFNEMFGTSPSKYLEN